MGGHSGAVPLLFSNINLLILYTYKTRKEHLFCKKNSICHLENERMTEKNEEGKRDCLLFVSPLLSHVAIRRTCHWKVNCRLFDFYVFSAFFLSFNYLTNIFSISSLRRRSPFEYFLYIVSSCLYKLLFLLY